MDITIDGKDAGRLTFDLYNIAEPKTVENFEALCKGDKGIGKELLVSPSRDKFGPFRVDVKRDGSAEMKELRETLRKDLAALTSIEVPVSVVI